MKYQIGVHRNGLCDCYCTLMDLKNIVLDGGEKKGKPE